SALRLLGLDSSWGVQGGLVFLDLLGGARPVHVYIIRECSAIHVIGVILGLIVPLKYGEWTRKAVGAAVGAALIFVLNVSRVMLTVYLTGYDVPPFSWFFTNPTVETYHYPVSFAYGVIGIAAVITIINAYILPELGDFLSELPYAVVSNLRGWLNHKKIG
ncbi:hypothetical protein JXL21_09180, partial [Candidatus Bathyarchaeota archaeon]|nr:hypothetical protein [Candidatus Bathyarchaeota archaeon]